MNRQLVLIALTLVSSFLFNPAFSAEIPEKTTPAFYTFGVFPFAPPGRLSKLFAPMVDEFEQILGKEIRFRTKSSIGIYNQELEKQTYDIVFLHPVQYVHGHDFFDYLPLARFGAPLKAILVAKADSQLQQLSDLKNKTIGLIGKFQFVDPLDLLIRISFIDQGFNLNHDAKVRYFKNPYSCQQHVLIGTIDACSTAPIALSRLEPNLQKKYRVIFSSSGIPDSTIAVHRRIPKQKRELLKRNILSWAHTESGKKIIATLHSPHFVEAMDADYNIVRDMLKRVQ